MEKDATTAAGRDCRTFVRLMADYCSDGVWNAGGAMMDRDSLPISQDLKDAIGNWCIDYESSQFYRDRMDRTVDFDTASFNALPGWTVVHAPQNA